MQALRQIKPELSPQFCPNILIRGLGETEKWKTQENKVRIPDPQKLNKCMVMYHIAIVVAYLRMSLMGFSIFIFSPHLLVL